MNRVMKGTVASAVVLAALNVSARTVAWYHFDETEPGTQTSQSTVIRNAADPGVLDGSCHAVDTTGALVETASALPVSSNAFAEIEVVDPVSGTVATANRCLHFTTERAASGQKSSVDSGVGSVVTIPNTGDKLHLSSFTVEFFVKSDIQASWSAGYQSPLSLPNFLGYRFSWGVIFHGGNMIFQAHSTADTTIGQIFAENVNVHDGRWHHVAVTYDGSTRAVKLYFDYTYRNGGTLSADIVYNNDYPLLVGANLGTNYRKWVGPIDEVRLSDEILPVEGFLRGKVVMPADELPVDEDTLVYHRFAAANAADAQEAHLARSAFQENESAAAGSFGYPDKVFNYGEAPAWSSDVGISRIATGDGFGPLLANSGSVSLRSNVGASEKKRSTCWGWSNPPVKLSDGSFTFETILRFPEKVTEQTYLFMANACFPLCYKPTGLELWWNSASTRALDDGKWHHVALTYDYATSVVKVYVDYQLEKTWTGSVGDKALPWTTDERSIAFGAYGNGAYTETVRNVDVDEVRLTRRALAAKEFLHASDGKSYFTLDFESDVPGGFTGTWANMVPEFNNAKWSLSDDVPADRMSRGVLGEAKANDASLCLDNGSSKAGGLLVMDPEKAIASNSFTAELFFRAPKDAYTTFGDDSVYLFCLRGCFYLRWEKSNGNLRYVKSDWGDVCTVSAARVNDGAWHHVALVSDKENNEVRGYFDYRLVGTWKGQLSCSTDDASAMISVGMGSWNPAAWQYSFSKGWLDNVRVSPGALKPCEFLTSTHLSGKTLVWSAFDGTGTLQEDVGEAYDFTGEGRLVSHHAGRVVDAQGTLIRLNTGSLGGGTSAASYSRLSILERSDVTVEFFLRGTAAESGTDLVALQGVDANHPVWALRQVGNELRVLVTDADGIVRDVAGAGALPSRWTHFALGFGKTSAGTRVTVLRDYQAVGEPVDLAYPLAVKGVTTSSLRFGAFTGNVDEFRVSRGVLDATDLLRAYRPGLILIFQ